MSNSPLSMAKAIAHLPSGLMTTGIIFHAGAVRSGVSQAKPCRLSFNAFACCIPKGQVYLELCMIQGISSSSNTPQKEVSMNKTKLLDGVREEYRQWEALLDQIGEARLDQLGAAADWSIKDIVAHLTGWRRRTVARLQAAQRGEGEPPSPWPAHLHPDVDLDAINAW